MAKTTAERQAAYRTRHLKEGEAERLNIVVSFRAAMALRRLAAHEGISQREVLERLIIDAQDAAVSGMNPAEQDAFNGVEHVTA